MSALALFLTLALLLPLTAVKTQSLLDAISEQNGKRKTNLPKVGKPYNIYQLRKFMGEVSEEPDFYILTHKGYGQHISCAHMTIDETANTKYTLKEDPTQIKKLVESEALTVENRDAYQQVMTYIEVPVGRFKQRLYLENPAPGKAKPGEEADSAATILANYRF